MDNSYLEMYPWLASDEPSSLGPARVAAQMGAHANWDKFMQEARRSTNVEDNRGDVGIVALLRALGTQALYQGHSDVGALRSLISHPFSHYGVDKSIPSESSDPIAIAAGYNSLKGK